MTGDYCWTEWGQCDDFSAKTLKTHLSDYSLMLTDISMSNASGRFSQHESLFVNGVSVREDGSGGMGHCSKYVSVECFWEETAPHLTSLWTWRVPAELYNVDVAAFIYSM